MGRITRRKTGANKRKTRIKGLRGRWMTHTVGPVLALAAVFVIIISASFAAYYYSNMQSDMQHRAKTTTEFFANYIGQSYNAYYQSCVTYARTFEEKNTIEEAENVVAETESQLSDLIESADEESALADVAENGKVKAKDLEAKIEELTQHVETEETIELELLMNQLPMQKKRLQAYLVGHPLCKSALTDKGSRNKDAFDSLYTHKAEIESALGTTLQWNRGDDIKSSKVFIQLNNVSIENETDWLQMANFHADWTKKFYDVIVPFIKG